MTNFDINNTRIPFKTGQSNIYGADCVGLVILYLRMNGFKCEWEKDLVKKTSGYDLFKTELEKNNFVKNKEGNIVLQRFIGLGHIGLCIDNKFVFQDNISRFTKFTDLPTNIYRYEYLGDL
jgi:hypothetical protein